MRPAIKFCGLTRAVDAAKASELAVEYAGVIFAGGPRSLSEERARDVLAALSASVKKVGVMSADEPRLLAQRALRLQLDVIQMHGDPEPGDVAALREEFEGEIWAVVRQEGVATPGFVSSLLSTADAVLVDSGSRGTLGGTGHAASWDQLHLPASGERSGKLILAGGLTADNVATAIGVIDPDVVDVSSGIESAPGVKDHQKMQAFLTAVQSVSGRVN